MRLLNPMRIGRTLPPAATPITIGQILSGIAAIFKPKYERERFRSELKEYFGVRYVFLLSSGKASLALILEALKEMNPGRRSVIIPAFTCYSVPSAIKRAGLDIVLCDIDADTLDFDFEQLEGLLGEQVLAVIPRHIFGIASDIGRLNKMVKGRGIAVVEDAAQTMGDSFGGRKHGTLGDAGVFSLSRGKAFSTVEGGIILTDREDLGQKLRGKVERVAEYGSIGNILLWAKAVLLWLCMHPWLFWIPKSLPFLKVGATIYDPNFKLKRLAGFQAGISQGWVDKLRVLREIREANAGFWAEGIGRANTRLKLFDNFSNDSHSQYKGSPVRFPVAFESADSAARNLELSEDNGLGVMLTYPDSVAGIPELAGELNDLEFTVASDYARRILTFPTHAYITETDKTRIMSFLKLGSA
jgi:perosamine synthetase